MTDRHADDQYILPDEEDAERLGGLASAIEHAERVMLQLDDEQAVALSPQAREGLTRVIAYLAQGSAVSINPVDQYLSTQEVADLLGVSRPHVIELLNREGIRHERAGGPGTHRRIALRDVLEYRERRIADVIRNEEGGRRRYRDSPERSAPVMA